MTEIEREEFLERLDLRINTIANMLGYHEKSIISVYLPYNKAKAYHNDIDKAIITFEKHIKEHDQKIKDYFRELE
jgi:hypothetical protein